MQPLFEGLELTGELGVHAEEIESALMMRWFPELVDYDAMAELKPTGLGPDDLTEWRKGGEHARRVTPQGFFGAPSPRDPFLWRFHHRMAAAMADLVTASVLTSPLRPQRTAPGRFGSAQLWRPSVGWAGQSPGRGNLPSRPPQPTVSGGPVLVQLAPGET